MIVEPSQRLRFFDTLSADCKFLEENYLLDYSLLVGVHTIRYPSDPLLDAIQSNDWQAIRWGGSRESFVIVLPPDNTHKELYFVSIVDILTKYDFLKMGEHTIKSLFQSSDNISCVPPAHYRKRFMKYIHSIVPAISLPVLSASSDAIHIQSSSTPINVSGDLSLGISSFLESSLSFSTSSFPQNSRSPPLSPPPEGLSPPLSPKPIPPQRRIPGSTEFRSSSVAPSHSSHPMSYSTTTLPSASDPFDTFFPDDSPLSSLRPHSSSSAAPPRGNRDR